MAKRQSNLYYRTLLSGLLLWCTSGDVRACPFDIWIVARAGQGEEFRDLEYLDGRFVAVGVETTPENVRRALIAWSTDGIVWTKSTSDLDDAESLRDIEFANGTWLAISGDSESALRSSDGVNWTEVPFPSEPVLDLAVSGDGFLIGGFSGPIIESTDALTWQEIHPESQDKFFSGIGIAKGTAFLLGERKDGFGTGVALKRNGDGSWLEVAGPWRGRLLQITHGNGTYVIAGYRPWTGDFGSSEILFYTSENAIDWREVSLSSDEWVTQLDLFNGMFVAVTSNGHVLRSTDGARWREYAGFAGQRPTRIKKVAFGKDRYVFLSDHGIVVSPDVTQPCLEILPQLPAHMLEMLGAAGEEYEVEVSSDLKSWSPWKRFVAEYGATVIQREPETGESALFFRARRTAE